MISVIVPAYNAEEYLDRCLESVLTQSLGDIEVIVVDDGSTDRTGQIASGFAAGDKRVRVVTRPNGGLSAAKNTGLDAVKGDTVTFVDSDDMLTAGALDTLKSVMDKTGCGIAMGGFTRHMSRRCDCAGAEQLDSRDAMEKILHQKRITVFNGSSWSKLYRTEVFEGLRFREGSQYEDLDLFYRLFDKAKTIGVTNAAVYYYMPNPASFIRNFSEHRLDVLPVVERLEEYMAANHPDLLPAARDRRLSANFDMFCLLSKVGGHGEVAEECWRTIRRYRSASLFNPKVRAKNKLGIIASYLGKRFVRFLARYYK